MPSLPVDLHDIAFSGVTFAFNEYFRAGSDDELSVNGE